MNRKKIAIFVLALVLAASLVCAVACDAANNNQAQQKIEKQNLLIFQSEYKLTQDQVMSQIKADYLLKNNGYQDGDKVVVILSLQGNSLMDSYLGSYSNDYKTVADYAESEIGQTQLSNLLDDQQNAVKQLTEQGLIQKVVCNYTTIMNAVAVETTYGNFGKLTKHSLAKTTILSETYNRPIVQATTDVSGIENAVDVYETGIFNSSTVSDKGITGKGTAVAVLDSGFDMSHSVFAYDEATFTHDMIKSADVAAVLGAMNASQTTVGLDVTKVYQNKKIPYAYDYADKDYDVYPYDSEHGTHVAGIIGGKDDEITGVAVDTQLVLMKVFPDLSEGGRTEDILAALEDAVLLNVDAINMSLGSSCGFAREEDGNKINEVYDKINESGISLITAASNSYSSAYGGEAGNTNKVTNPDSGTVGSPSTYGPSLSVASISGVKSRYIVGNDSQVFFFNESNDITGDPNNFVEELGIKAGESKTFDYVTIPGIGAAYNFRGVDVKGKIALVKRGSNTFEEKALNAKQAGAVACIIYNNIEGDILMSMGKTDHIPTISISKSDGEILASRSSGKMEIAYNNQAGPFMSDFSSWGPTPSLQLKPEITAHGGEIRSAIPGGKYDNMSGTSMATPNLCGVVILIRQYLKETFPDKSWKEISVLTNEMLMSTATIIQNQEGNPYSPRKQGAGLASLYNVVYTDAYIAVEGQDRSKLELGDDPQKTGVYQMQFQVVNLKNKTLTYDLSLLAMTESVSTSDKDYVAERSHMLDNNFTAEVVSGNGTIEGTTLTVGANTQGGTEPTVTIKVTYTMTQSDKQMMDEQFANGMYVEGFVVLNSLLENGIDLNIPFLAFYGDWTAAPMFDKTYYEVESEAHDPAIDEEEKIKADYFATTPYGSYFYNYIIPLGTYLYDQDGMTDPIPASEDRIAISNILGTIDGITSIYAGLLRGAKQMDYTITDKLTGEVVWTYTDYNAQKSYFNGQPFPYYEQLYFKSYSEGLVNNRTYTFSMKGVLDYGDGGVTTNQRNEFSFDFMMDEEAPVLKSVTYEKEYDRTLKKYRYYMTMTIYDNHYAMSISPVRFTSSSTYTLLTENPIPIYSQKGQDSVVRFEITDYLADVGEDALISSGLAFSIDDYALNSNIYICQLPGTNGEFKFTEDGTADGEKLSMVSIYEDEVLDLTQYLYSTDKTLDADKDYLKTLQWSSSNETYAKVNEGIVWGIGKGRAYITVTEQMYGEKASIIVNVKARETATANATAYVETDSGKTIKAQARRANGNNDTVSDAVIKEVRFNYFDTVFAFDRAAQTSEIGTTDSRTFLNDIRSISFYPGEQIRLNYDVEPWYVADKYKFTYESSNPEIATVDETGLVMGLKEGSTTIVLNVEGSYQKATIPITIKNPFVIENRQLIAYKGLGGKVVIPDDEGILYIASYAFCLYTTDNQIELPEDDYDANKIPSKNTSITSIVVPEGVEQIQKYAFYNCTALEEVVLPKSIRFIREYAFCDDQKLTKINLQDVEAIGAYAFKNCTSLAEVDLAEAYAIGVGSFEGCTALTEVDLTALRNTGKQAFKDCTNLANVTFGPHTKLSYAMFANSGLTSVDIYNSETVLPDFCFANNTKLTTVTLHGNLLGIGEGIFSGCETLATVNIKGRLDSIGRQAFFNAKALQQFSLPNNNVSVGDHAFNNTGLTTLNFGENTTLANFGANVFSGTDLATFVVHQNNAHYATNGNYLTDKAGTTILLAAIGATYGDLVIDSNIVAIGDSAFAGTDVATVTITNSNTVIGKYAFADCRNLTKVTLPTTAGNVVIGARAFYLAPTDIATGEKLTSLLTTVENLELVKNVGDYAFSFAALTTANVAADAVYGEGVFFQSKLQSVTIGANATFGLGAFQNCLSLTTVNMPAEGGVHFGPVCFAYDSALHTIDLTKVDDTIEMQTFYGCKALKSVNLANVKHIGTYAFGDCSGITSVSIPMVETIGEGAFGRYDDTNGGAPAITSITLPNTLTSIGQGAFIGSEKLLEVTIPEGITEIANYVFAFCKSLETVTLPASVKRIGVYSFAGCDYLETINVNNVEVFADYAFTSCLSLANISLSSAQTIGYGAFADTIVTGAVVAPNLVEVGDFAFQGTQLVSFTANKLQRIGMGAFQSNAYLTSFMFSNELQNVDLLAFEGCSALTTFNYATDSSIVTNGAINDYAMLEDGILYTYMPNGKLQLTAVPGGKNISTLVVNDQTYRVDAYAGNGNKNITKIVLPDTLRVIGEHAFDGYTKLQAVEFKSFTAPTLENSYDPDAVLNSTDPGYELLQNQFDLFGYELCYFNFVGLVGKNKPIKMILPSNAGVEGYDSLVYLVYFGSVADAERSTYEARDKNLVNFYDYAVQIAAIPTITLTNETLVNKAIAALNATTQDPAKFGYDMTEWNSLVEDVKQAKETIVALKIANASQRVKDVQALINTLPSVFNIDDIALIQSVASQINALDGKDKALLDLTKFNTLVASYNQYRQSVSAEVAPVKGAIDNMGKAIAVAVATTLAALALAAVVGKRGIM